MPLDKRRNKDALESNIHELIEAGHDPKQASAIAYKTYREAGGKDPKRKKK